MTHGAVRGCAFGIGELEGKISERLKGRCSGNSIKWQRAMVCMREPESQRRPMFDQVNSDLLYIYQSSGKL